jgi:hypothetical protein
MAFVGYKTSGDAATAQKYFDHTFIYASRIAVEVRAYACFKCAAS